MHLQAHKNFKLTRNEKEFFLENGYMIVENAINDVLQEALEADCQVIASESESAHVNEADIISRGMSFIKLATLPTILPKITGLLGWNIWINHSHVNLHPPNKLENDGSFEYGWHRDGGAIEDDLLDETPWFGIKVGFFLTDTVSENTGTTLCIPGSHKDNRSLPGDFTLPSTAVPISVPAGTALLMHPRIIHSIRSQNFTNHFRKVVFVQWAYRWLHPVDANTTARIDHKVSDPYERQLLGLSTNPSALKEKYARGRSGWYYPGDEEVPLKKYLQKLYGTTDKKYFKLA